MRNAEEMKGKRREITLAHMHIRTHDAGTHAHIARVSFEGRPGCRSDQRGGQAQLIQERPGMQAVGVLDHLYAGCLRYASLSTAESSRQLFMSNRPPAHHVIFSLAKRKPPQL